MPTSHDVDNSDCGDFGDKASKHPEMLKDLAKGAFVPQVKKNMTARRLGGPMSA
jgi:hypothetical protein